jgi:HK97 family phage portal protein
VIADLFRRLPDRSAGLKTLPPRQNASLISQVSPSASFSENDAMGISAFGRGVRLVSRTIGMLPLCAERNGVEIDDDPPLLRRPCPWEERQTTITAMARSIIVHGNYVAILGDVDPSTGWPSSILPVPVGTVSVALTDLGLFYRIGVGQAKTVYRSVDVLHLKGPVSPGDLVGRGALADGTSALSMATSVDEATRNYYGQGVYPSGVLQAGWEIDDAEATLTRQKWVSRVRRGEPVVLPPGITWTPMGSPSAEAQQLQMAANLSRVQIADILDLEPEWLSAAGAHGSITYQNVVDRLAHLVRLTCQPIMTTIETGLSSLLPRNVEAKLETSAFLAGQTKERYDAYAVALSGGWLTVDEVREREGLEPLTQELGEPLRLVEGAA